MVARLKWLQSLARNPGNHEQVLAALLGDCGMQKVPTLNNDGAVGAGANPWIKLLVKDLEGLEDIEEGSDFLRLSRTVRAILL